MQNTSVQDKTQAQGTETSIPQAQFDLLIGRNDTKLHNLGEEFTRLIADYDSNGDTRAFMNKAKQYANQLSQWSCMNVGKDNSIAYTPSSQGSQGSQGGQGGQAPV